MDAAEDEEAAGGLEPREAADATVAAEARAEAEAAEAAAAPSTVVLASAVRARAGEMPGRLGRLGEAGADAAGAAAGGSKSQSGRPVNASSPVGSSAQDVRSTMNSFEDLVSRSSLLY